MSVFGVVAMVSCSRPAPPPPIARTTVAQADIPPPASRPPAVERAPASVVQVGESAQELFDIARASKWDDAAASVAGLHDAVAALNVNGLKPDLVAQLRSRITDLTRSVTARERVPSMDAANRVTHIVAELVSPDQPDVPYQVELLAYYGRQLELGLAASRPATLKQATADLRQTWNAIEPSVLRRGQVDEARRFTDIVVQLEGAKVPADFVAPARAELAAADRLEKIFKQ